MDSISAAQHRIQPWALLNAVMNLRVPKNAWKILGG
jgi:hypothetical protein